MHVFASFARKRVKPRAPRSCAVPHRPEVVENAKKAPYPKKNRVLEKSELGWVGWVGLGWAGLGSFENSRVYVAWVGTWVGSFLIKK